MSRLLCTCGKSYDVSGRAPGSRVRCRACQSVLTVPKARGADPVRSASERLRRARGEPCTKHPKTLAVDPCESCNRWMCSQCRAPAPSSHLCRECAPRVGATTALPVDFGLLATPFIAAKLALRTLKYLLPFNAIAHSFKWLLMVPFFFAIYAIGHSMDLVNPQTGEVVLFYSVAAAASLLVSFFDLVLVPAADLLLLDSVLRGEANAPFGRTLVAAFGRAWNKKGSLVFAYVLLIAAVIGSLLVLLPFVLGYFLTEEIEVIYAGILLAMPAAGAVLGSFGLSIPAVILEHRSAPQAFGRAWNLARLRPWSTVVFGTAFVMIGVIVSYRVRELEIRWGLVPALLVTFCADIAWPALLVAAYHGLVAEEARLVGRRS